MERIVASCDLVKCLVRMGPGSSWVNLVMSHKGKLGYERSGCSKEKIAKGGDPDLSTAAADPHTVLLPAPWTFRSICRIQILKGEWITMPCMVERFYLTALLNQWWLCVTLCWKQVWWWSASCKNMCDWLSASALDLGEHAGHVCAHLAGTRFLSKLIARLGVGATGMKESFCSSVLLQQ